MTITHKALAQQRIGVFGKGGSGKSTFSVLFARVLVERGYHVCLIDADSTNLGISQALGFKQAPSALIDHFGGMIFSGGLVTCPVDDPVPLQDAQFTLDELPPGFYARSGNLTFMVAGKITQHGPGAGCDGPVAKIARDLRVTESEIPLVTLIDFKAGFEDTARGVVTGLDWVIVVVDPTTAAIDMALRMRNMVEKIRADVLPATAHLDDPQLVAWANRLFTESQVKGTHVVLNRVQNMESERFMFQLLEHKGIYPIGIIHEDPEIALAWLRGELLVSEKASQETRKLLGNLEEVIA